jgi:nucleotide-binding universal stress UspA family protein
MGNKILIAVDDSDNALKAVQYVAKIAKPTSTVTLLSVLPGIAPGREIERAYMKPEFKEDKTFISMEEAMRSAMEAFMEKVEKILLNADFASDNIRTVIQKKKVGVARDILKEAAQGQYDTIVVGRRGLSGVKQFVFGSVSNKIIHLAKSMAVTVVD